MDVAPVVPVSKPGRGWCVALAALSLLAVAAGLYMNRRGVDVEPDSAVYVTAGLLFAHGQGISMPNLIGAPKPMVWFPPATSWMVALCEWSGLDIRASFGVFNAITWGVLTCWVGLLARRAAGGRSVPGLLAAGAILTSSSICTVNGFLYSEPLFLLCLMGALTSLAAWWKSPVLGWVVVAGFCTGVGLLSRYVGVTLLGFGGLVMLARPGSRWRRLAPLALFTTLGGGPILAWHFFQKTAHHATTAGRTLAWHPLTGDQIDVAIGTIASFIVPSPLADSPWQQRVIVVLLTGAIALSLWIWLRRQGSTWREKIAALPPIVGMSAAFIAIYVGFLVLSISIADSSTPLDWRILSIIVPPGAVIAACLAAVTAWENRRARGTLVVIVSGILVTSGWFTFRDEVHRNQMCLAPGWTSPVLDALSAVPSDATVFSSAPCEVYMAVRRKTEDLPHPPPEDGWHGNGTNNYEGEIAAMKKALAHGGWVVYWVGLYGSESIPQDTLQTLVPVAETKTFWDGALLRIAPAPPKQ